MSATIEELPSKPRYPGKLVMQPDTAFYLRSASSLKRLDEIIQELKGKRETLRKVSMYDMELPEHLPDFYLDPLLEAVGSIPHLESFDSSIRNVKCITKRPLIKPETLRRFLQNASHLMEVTLWNWSLEDAHIIEGLVPGLLSDHSNVQFLSLRRNPRISSLAWRSLYGIVEHKAALAFIISDTAFIPSDRQLFFLDLNQRGRRHLLAEKNHNAVSVLGRFSRESLDLFNYWVQQLVPGLLASRVTVESWHATFFY